jgi:nitrite reductase/ring-hydroxylating ferredoxin subunit
MRQTAPEIGERTSLFELGPPGEVLVHGRAIVTVEPNDTSVLIVQTRRGVFAIQNRCPHLGFPLDKAAVRGRHLKCAFHGREYDMSSGVCRGDPKPGTRPLTTYRAWIDQGHLFLALRSEATE